MKINKKYLKKIILYEFGTMKILAEKIDVSESTVYKWFSETGNIPMKKLNLILDNLKEIQVDKSRLFIEER